jgi:hypothetical protein
LKFKKFQLGINVTWQDAYYQHDEILKIKYIFNYQIPHPNVEKMDDSIDSKSKLLQPPNIWIDNIDNEINDSCPIIIFYNHNQYWTLLFTIWFCHLIM